MDVQWLVRSTLNRQVSGLATPHLLGELGALKLLSVRAVRKRIQICVKVASYIFLPTLSLLSPGSTARLPAVIVFITHSWRCTSLRDLIKDTK